MAIYHCSIKIISRGKGKSAVAAAAYRAGETITNEKDGITHSYTHKRGIVYTEILLSENAPSEYTDRAVLWNAVEKIEKAKNAQLAREIEIALPAELTREQNISLVREYVGRHFVAAGMCADVCIHDKNDGNPHVHIMLTMRPFDKGGQWGSKQKKEYILDPQGNKIYDRKKRQYNCKSIPTTDWNEQTKAEEWRGAWAEICNCYLEQNKHVERIDHRSYERQEIKQIPTIHLGASVSQMEKRGIRTDCGNRSREIEATNLYLRKLKSIITKLQSLLKIETESTQVPTLADNIYNILLRKVQAEDADASQLMYSLKDTEKIRNYLTSNNIVDMRELEKYLDGMLDRRTDIWNKIELVDQRLNKLKEYLERTGIYLKYKEKKVLTDSEKVLYTTSYNYLKGLLGGDTTLPVAAWKTEYAKLTAARKILNQKYAPLIDEINEVEQIKKSVCDILRQEQRAKQPHRPRSKGR